LCTQKSRFDVTGVGRVELFGQQRRVALWLLGLTRSCLTDDSDCCRYLVHRGDLEVRVRAHVSFELDVSRCREHFRSTTDGDPK
jgi:hypothetical protein